MKTVYFGAALIMLSLFCQTFGQYLALPIPVSLLGMAMLLIFLILLRRVPAGLSKVTQLLLGNMALFFVPITLSVFTLDNDLQQHIWTILGALFISTVLSLAVTAWIAQKLLSGNRHEH